MNKNKFVRWEDMLLWIECDDYEQLKGKIRFQKETWKHEEESAKNQKEVEKK